MIKGKWSDEEVEYLKSIYQDINLSVMDIANLMNRSKDSVQKKASSLGIKKIRISEIPVKDGHKICRNCHEEKPTTEFYNNKGSITGDNLVCYCKTCERVLEQERRHKKIMDEIKAKVEAEDRKLEMEKEQFIKDNTGIYFQCAYCKKEYTIDEFIISRKNNKYIKSSYCKVCNRIRVEEYKIKTIKIKGHT